MAFPPTRAAYEALINEVKLLKEENKQLRDEIKETSRSTLEVELEPETRDRKASRNSWMESIIIILPDVHETFYKTFYISLSYAI